MAASEVRLSVGPKEARLLLVHDNKVIDEEVWPLPRQMGQSEARLVVKAVFDSTYDFLNAAVNDDD